MRTFLITLNVLFGLMLVFLVAYGSVKMKNASDARLRENSFREITLLKVKEAEKQVIIVRDEAIKLDKEIEAKQLILDSLQNQLKNCNQ